MPSANMCSVLLSFMALLALCAAQRCDYCQCLTNKGFAQPCNRNTGLLSGGYAFYRSPFGRLSTGRGQAARSSRIWACFQAQYGECRVSCDKDRNRCLAIRKKQDKIRARRAAAQRQKKAAVAKALYMYDKTEGVVMVPGPRGTLGHKRRCAIANNARINDLASDKSEQLWRKSKKLIDAALKLLLNKEDIEGIKIVQDTEAECRRIGNDIGRIEFVNSVGGGKIDDLFKKGCDLSGHLDGIVENQLSNLVKKLVFDTHVGEYLALALRGANSQDYCAMVCKKNKSGVAEKACIYGCAETFQEGCWSQCDLYSCKRGCKNAFWHRRRKRRRCYDRCARKCSY